LPGVAAARIRSARNRSRQTIRRLVAVVFATWLGRGKADAALQLALIDAEAIALSAFLTTAMQRSIGRARPFLRECGSSPTREADCGAAAESRNTSFVSGHASLAFTAASTLCVQHSRLGRGPSFPAPVVPMFGVFEG
jgi:membrane-associated phospholipid phosphatase